MPRCESNRVFVSRLPRLLMLATRLGRVGCTPRHFQAAATDYPGVPSHLPPSIFAPSRLPSSDVSHFPSRPFLFCQSPIPFPTSYPSPPPPNSFLLLFFYHPLQSSLVHQATHPVTISPRHQPFFSPPPLAKDSFYLAPPLRGINNLCLVSTTVFTPLSFFPSRTFSTSSDKTNLIGSTQLCSATQKRGQSWNTIPSR